VEETVIGLLSGLEIFSGKISYLMNMVNMENKQKLQWQIVYSPHYNL
jgi:hypothetical protein